MSVINAIKKRLPDLDIVYTGVGIGSSICALIGVRNALKLKTEIVGVVSERANCYRLSFERGSVVQTGSALTFADGLAVRIPDPNALLNCDQSLFHIPLRTDLKIVGTYPIAFGFSIGAVLQSYAGAEVPVTWSVASASTAWPGKLSQAKRATGSRRLRAGGASRRAP